MWKELMEIPIIGSLLAFVGGMASLVVLLLFIIFVASMFTPAHGNEEDRSIYGSARTAPSSAVTATMLTNSIDAAIDDAELAEMRSDASARCIANQKQGVIMLTQIAAQIALNPEVNGPIYKQAIQTISDTWCRG
jgi:hypothetical protein